MHATRDTNAVINLNLVGGRVMSGVRPLKLEALQEFYYYWEDNQDEQIGTNCWH
jgi:hypothetical protein